MVHVSKTKGFPGDSVVKNPPANAGDAGSIPGSGRSPGAGNGNPLQYPSLDDPIEAWRATAHGVAKSPVGFCDTHTHCHSGLQPHEANLIVPPPHRGIRQTLALRGPTKRPHWGGVGAPGPNSGFGASAAPQTRNHPPVRTCCSETGICYD